MDAYVFGLDIVYLHMDLNHNVCSAFSVTLAVADPMNRSTSRDSSSPGTDSLPTTLRIRSSTGVVTREQRPTGIGR